MKKYLLIVLIIFISSNSFSQIKSRSDNINYYAGIGYKLVFLTDNTARNAFPFFQLSSGDFMKEITGQFGAVFNEIIAAEFAPAYMFTTSYSTDGFYYTGAVNGRRFYVPTDSRLFALPLNLKVKVFPQGKNYTSFLNKVYLSAGAGMMYFSEEIIAQVYTDDINYNYIGSARADDEFWNFNYEFAIGLASYSKIGYGFELSYRIVPLDNDVNKPLITTISSNFNSVNLSANIVFSF